MSGTNKKKLCWNCEGSVSLEEENCPYCSVYLGPAAPSSEEGDQEEVLAPPYRIVEEEGEESDIPDSAYSERENQEADHGEYEASDIVLTADPRKVLIPLSLLLGGSVFFLFGLVLLMFSHDGMFTLSWNGAYWYVYFISAIPMLALGWRALGQLSEEEGEKAPVHVRK